MLTRRECIHLIGGAGIALALPGCAGSLPLRADRFPRIEDQTEPFMGLATSLSEEFDYEADIEGKIPEELRGTLYRNTTGLYDRNGLRKRTMFDGDGMIQSFRFHDAGVRYRNRYVQTEKYLEESSAGRFIYPTFSTQAPGGWLANFWAGSKVRNQAQITVTVRNGRLYAFDESAQPYELDPETLETIGISSLGLPRESAVFGAHSKIDPRTDEWLLFGLHYGEDVTLHITILGPDDHPKSHRTIVLPRYVYIHDFFATAHSFVFNLHPLYLQVSSFLLGRRSLAESLSWRPGEGSIVLVVPKEGGEPPLYLQADPYFMWHTINAYERDGTIIADFIGYGDPDHLLGENSPVFASMRGERGSYRFPGIVRRMQIHTGRRSVRTESIVEGNFEWPAINLLNRCSEYRFGYTAHARPGDFFWSGITRFDTTTGKANHFFFDEGLLCGEPIFVPRPGFGYRPESDSEPGWILTLVYNGKTKKSFLSVLLADNLPAGPIASVHLRHHSPFSMHGFWHADEAGDCGC